MERSAALPVPSLFHPIRVFFSCTIPHFLVGIIRVYTVGYSASKVYMIAAANKFLRIYYAKVNEVLKV